MEMNFKIFKILKILKIIKKIQKTNLIYAKSVEVKI